MKNLLRILFSTILLTLIIGTQSASAEDCMHDPIYPKNWTAEVTTGVRVRSIPCMETSIVLSTLPVGEIVQVIAETDGYYQIKTANGTEGWVGQWLISQTNKTFQAQSTSIPTTVTPVTTETLPDIRGHKNEAAIWSLYYSGIISGHQDGYFRPDSTLNRAEILKIVLEATIPNFDQYKTSQNNSCFTDISPDMWYTHYVCYSKEKNIVQGYSDGSFKASNPVTRAEAVKIILEVFKIPVPELADSEVFTDSSLSNWHSRYLQAANEKGLLEETTGLFNPNSNMLRGAVSHIVNQAMLSVQ